MHILLLLDMLSLAFFSSFFFLSAAFRLSVHTLSGPFQAHLLERWQQGCHNVSQLDRELRSLGYKGSRRSLYRFVATFDLASGTSGEDGPKASDKQNDGPLSSSAALTLSVPQATWLFFRKETDLDETEQQNLEQLRQAHPSVEKAYQLVSAFLLMVRERTGQQLEQWLIDARCEWVARISSVCHGCS